MVAAWLTCFAPALADGARVRFVQFETTVNPVSAHRILQAVDDAEAAGDDLVLIRLDTPGGMVASMDSIVKRILNAEVPIVVWVGPSGARAASAGFFILIAADVAAMAPGTRTGAASTVFGSGEASTEDNVMLKKMNEDGAALLRSIAERRGRNPEACERAVFAAKAYEESVALEQGLIDMVQGSVEELLAALDGREIERFDGSRVVLNTAGAQLVTTEFSFRQEFMEFLANPSIAYILLSLGLLGIFFEITHPGTVLPGVVGALCLLLFAIAAQALPLSTIGVLLLVLAIVMFVLELKVASYGMLTVGAVACLLVGSMMLIDGPIPELRVPFYLVLPITLTIAALCVMIVRLVVQAQRTGLGTGVEGLALETGTVTVELTPAGKVFIRGETWNATSDAGPIAEGTRVRVVRVDGMMLTVEPIDVSSAGGS